MLFGYDIGVSGGALVSLTSTPTSLTDWGPGLSPLLMGLVVSSSLMGALAGSVAVLMGNDRLGRRTELLGAAGLYGRLRPLGVVLLPETGCGLLVGCGLQFGNRVNVNVMQGSEPSSWLQRAAFHSSSWEG